MNVLLPDEKAVRVYMVVIFPVRNGRNVPIPTEAFGETGMYQEELDKDGKGF